MKKLLIAVCAMSVVFGATVSAATTNETTYTEKFIKKHTQKVVDTEKNVTNKVNSAKAKEEAAKADLKQKQADEKAKLQKKQAEQKAKLQKEQEKIKQKQAEEKAKLQKKQAEQKAKVQAKTDAVKKKQTEQKAKLQKKKNAIDELKKW